IGCFAPDFHVSDMQPGRPPLARASKLPARPGLPKPARKPASRPGPFRTLIMHLHMHSPPSFVFGNGPEDVIFQLSYLFR
ncbi:hypothetical protein BDD12DRAFT_848161, partial [Trichophaea hybrida]